MEGVERLIRVHEDGGWPEADLLQAADSLSFLETMVPLVVGWVESDGAAPARAGGRQAPELRWTAFKPSLARARELASRCCATPSPPSTKPAWSDPVTASGERGILRPGTAGRRCRGADTRSTFSPARR